MAATLAGADPPHPLSGDAAHYGKVVAALQGGQLGLRTAISSLVRTSVWRVWYAAALLFQAGWTELLLHQRSAVLLQDRQLANCAFRVGCYIDWLALAALDRVLGRRSSTVFNMLCHGEADDAGAGSLFPRNRRCG